MRSGVGRACWVWRYHSDFERSRADCIGHPHTGADRFDPGADTYGYPIPIKRDWLAAR